VSGITRCRDCGARIRLVLVVPARIDPNRPRGYIPLEVDFDAARSPIPPSHGLNLARTVCHPITDATPLLEHEVPALTHFAVCPARTAPRSPTPTR